MPFNQLQRTFGFIPYGSSDPDVLEYASFLNAADVGSAVIVGDVDFDTVLGARVAATQSVPGRLRWINTFAADMANGGHVSFDMTPELFDDATKETGNAVLFYIGGSNAAHVRKASANLEWELGHSGTSTLAARLFNDSFGATVRVHVSWDNKGVDLYVNYILAQHYDWISAMPSFNGDLNIGGLNDTFQITKSRFSNIQWCKRPIMLPVNNSALNVVFTGDSYTKLGQYPLSDFAYLGEQAESYADTTIKSVTTNRNMGMIPMCHGELAKRGVYIGDRIHFHGRGSTEATAASSKPLSERTDSIFAGEGGTDYPSPGQRSNTQIIVCNVGTNDVLQAETDADFEAGYKAEIDRWDAAGIAHMILFNIAQRYESDLSAPKDTADILAKNVIIKSLETYNSKVKVIDTYTLTSRDSSYIKDSDGIHPSVKGQAWYGEQAAIAIASVI